jgi:hypothetical protein
VTGDAGEYESLAVRLARDPALLGALRNRLAANRRRRAALSHDALRPRARNRISPHVGPLGGGTSAGFSAELLINRFLNDAMFLSHQSERQRPGGILRVDPLSYNGSANDHNINRIRIDRNTIDNRF